MKIKSGFKLRKMVGENVVTAEGQGSVRFDKIIVLNETATCLWKAVEGKDFTLETLRDILLENYEVEASQASADAASLLESWKSVGLITE